MAKNKKNSGKGGNPSGSKQDNAQKDAPLRKSVGPLKFMQQVRSEGEKITWTSRQETLISSIMVVIMVIIASMFFMFADQIIKMLIGFLSSLFA